MKEPKHYEIMSLQLKHYSITILGAIFIALGINYYSDRDYYQIPFFIFPIFELIGNKMYATILVIIGLSLIYIGFKKNKNLMKKKYIYLILAVVSIIAGYIIIRATDKTQKPIINNENHNNNSDTPLIHTNTKEVVTVRRPNIDDASANIYLDHMEKLYNEMLIEKGHNNTDKFKNLEIQYIQHTQKLNDISPKIKEKSYFKDFIQYNGHLVEKISKLRKY